MLSDHHYQSLSPTHETDEVPPAWLEQTDVKPRTFYRGGGPKSTSSRLSLPASTCKSSASKPSSMLSLPAETDAHLMRSQLSLPASPSTRPAKAKSQLSVPSMTPKSSLASVHNSASSRKQHTKSLGYPKTNRTGPHSHSASSSVGPPPPGRNAAAKGRARKARGQVGVTVWNCPLCKINFQGTAQQVYNCKRRHIQTRHPSEKYSVFIGKAQITVCEASENLPADQIAWQCPCCPRALPALPKRAAHLAVSAHRRKFHPDLTTREWRSRMVSLWAKGVKKPRVSQKQREFAAKKRRRLWKTHEVVEVVDSSEKARHYRHTAQFWCIACASRVGGYGGNNRVMSEKLTCAKAKKLPQQRQRCQIAWKCLQDKKTPDNKPVRDLLHSWIRDLVQDGDVEPNPGPTTSLKFNCVNCQGAAHVWHTLELAQNDQLAVVALQEIAFSPKEAKAFQAFAFKKRISILLPIVFWC